MMKKQKTSMDTFTDQDIIDGIRSSNSLVIEWVYRRFGEAVFKQVRYKGGNDTEADEVFQITMIRVWKKLQKEEYTPMQDSSFKSYFLGIAKRVWLEQLKAKKKSAAQNIEDVLFKIKDTHFETISIELVQNSKYSKLHKALKQLNNSCEELIRTRYFKGWKFTEIAEEEDKLSVTVRQQHRRCMKRLKEVLNKLQIIE